MDIVPHNSVPIKKIVLLITSFINKLGYIYISMKLVKLIVLFDCHKKDNG